MFISLIVAMSENRVIGVNGKLPWHLPNDLKRFKQLTMGKPIVMGRKTFESIGRALPGRRNIILTNNQSFKAEGCVVVHSLNGALQAAQESDEVMIIGGAEIYKLFFPIAHRIYLTIVHTNIEGDAYFPELGNYWIELERQFCVKDEKHVFDYTNIDLKSKRIKRGMGDRVLV